MGDRDAHAYPESPRMKYCMDHICEGRDLPCNVNRFRVLSYVQSDLTSLPVLLAYIIAAAFLFIFKYLDRSMSIKQLGGYVCMHIFL